MNNPTSHDYAKSLQLLAEFLLARPPFALPSIIDLKIYETFRFTEKERFIAAVKAIGAGQKHFTADDIEFRIKTEFASLNITAPRATVCRLIRPAEYDCDPLLSPEEEKSLGGAA